MGWNWIDWSLVMVIAVSVLAAIWEGLIRELISIAAILAGLVIAAQGYREAANWFKASTTSPEVAQGLGFVALFLGTVLAGAVLIFLTRKLLEKSGLLWFDRFLGGIFGLIRGFAICSVLLLAMVAFSIKAAAVQDSTLAPYVLLGARITVTAMPGDIKSRFQKGFEQYRNSLAQKDRKAQVK